MVALSSPVVVDIAGIVGLTIGESVDVVANSVVGVLVGASVDVVVDGVLVVVVRVVVDGVVDGEVGEAVVLSAVEAVVGVVPVVKCVVVDGVVVTASVEFDTGVSVVARGTGTANGPWNRSRLSCLSGTLSAVSISSLSIASAG